MSRFGSLNTGTPQDCWSCQILWFPLLCRVLSTVSQLFSSGPKLKLQHNTPNWQHHPAPTSFDQIKSDWWPGVYNKGLKMLITWVKEGVKTLFYFHSHRTPLTFSLHPSHAVRWRKPNHFTWLKLWDLTREFDYIWCERVKPWQWKTLTFCLRLFFWWHRNMVCSDNGQIRALNSFR